MRKLSLIIASLVLFAHGPAEAAKYTMTVCGASPGGLWSLLGAGIDSAMKAAYPGSTMTYQTSGGGFANVNLIKQKKCELAIVHDAELTFAVQGRKPFKRPVSGLNAIAVMYNWGAAHLFVNRAWAKKHGIASMEDIAMKKPPMRLVVNKRGNINAAMGLAAFEALGVSDTDIKSWGGQVLYYASRAGAGLMKDRRADVNLNNLFVRHGSYRDMINSVNVTLVPIPAKVNQFVQQKFQIGSWNIPNESYAGDVQSGAMDVYSASAVLIAPLGMNAKTAYDVTKALVEKLAKIQGVHKAMRALSPKIMVSQKAIPYHPGALRYFKEARLMK